MTVISSPTLRAARKLQTALLIERMRINEHMSGFYRVEDGIQRGLISDANLNRMAKWSLKTKGRSNV